jgi:hypothetical protein
MRKILVKNPATDAELIVFEVSGKTKHLLGSFLMNFNSWLKGQAKIVIDEDRKSQEQKSEGSAA